VPLHVISDPPVINERRLTAASPTFGSSSSTAHFGSVPVNRHAELTGRFCAQPTLEGPRSTIRTLRADAASQPHAEFRARPCARPRTLHPLIESHRHPLIWLARRRGIGKLRVFGSMARGDADARGAGPCRAARRAPDTPAAGADHALPRWTRLGRQSYDRASAAKLELGGRWT